jgi:hypothetical protein
MKNYVEIELKIYLFQAEDIIMDLSGEAGENPSTSDDNEMPFVPFF